MGQAKGNGIPPPTTDARSHDYCPIINKRNDSQQQLHRDILPLSDHDALHLHFLNSKPVNSTANHHQPLEAQVQVHGTDFRFSAHFALRLAPLAQFSTRN